MNPAVDLGGSHYPVQLEFAPPKPAVRFWAIPLLGMVAKLIFLIPHLVVLYLLAILVSIYQLALWVPVLFGGQYPDYGYRIVGGYLRWSVRVQAYFYGLTDEYPPFRLRP